VGQGDALLVDLPDGRVVLVDGGGFATAMPDTGRRVLLPALRARGKKAVDLMVVSHAHPDHIGGLLGVAAELPVRQLWHPEDPARTPSLRALTEKVRRRGGSIWGPKELCQADGPARRARRMGGVTFRVLHSCTEEATSTEPEMGLNDGSLVLRLQFGERSFLLTGDVEARGERRLTESFGDELAVDVLKIPHHGSDTSSGENFLELAQPRVAIISSGVRNRFAHPRASVLRRLRSRGIEIWRTDRSGSVSLVTDGSSLWMRTAQTTYSDKPDILSLWRPSIRRILPRSKS
jgi:beta-lactamase superfamily II metal-dependent hydrolase